ncbi:TetR/AcrR family transcriptional regulator [Acetobacter syzygii]|uniref:TetR family transcriptional regulator n=1 Tax=Acetobacter syzygii TaxID=146476 RepID=A0A270BEK0_9PROT|nr:TetR/AcrR family transcriptional regulator [Acetobacter syzygii]NSL92397.1 TetR/AcrR family transcriptional regulator [Acetobacter syzygii]PAL23467.1 TetR family transcriptional regulator [Acetobacter syzygii]PAL24147.1 TetR family transcriptional regulator [Acetobacter syzygii]GAN71733.1 transcriptional regulator TetR [Acetobacter syzygii]GBR62193.1 TetR family transcriptional regulator [Acetobacter syzygii NRIC 0483]
MARPRTIDREKVLACAEQLVQRNGATALTLDAVAREAGITKGGLQYCFGSKDDLIAALIERWIVVFDTQVAQCRGTDTGPLSLVRAYVQACSRIDSAARARMVGMLVTLLQSPRHLARIKGWYARLLGYADGHAVEARQIRTMIFAAEGAFFLRSFGFVDMQDAEWKTVFADIQNLALPTQAGAT